MSYDKRWDRSQTKHAGYAQQSKENGSILPKRHNRGRWVADREGILCQLLLHDTVSATRMLVLESGRLAQAHVEPTTRPT